MQEWLRKILDLCAHDFEIIEEVSFKCNGLYNGKVYVQKCKMILLDKKSK